MRFTLLRDTSGANAHPPGPSFFVFQLQNRLFLFCVFFLFIPRYRAFVPRCWWHPLFLRFFYITSFFRFPKGFLSFSFTKLAQVASLFSWNCPLLHLSYPYGSIRHSSSLLFKPFFPIQRARPDFRFFWHRGTANIFPNSLPPDPNQRQFQSMTPVIPALFFD